MSGAVGSSISKQGGRAWSQPVLSLPISLYSRVYLYRGGWRDKTDWDSLCVTFSVGTKIQQLEKSGPVACEHRGEEFSKADSRNELVTSFCSIFKATLVMPFSGH